MHCTCDCCNDAGYLLNWNSRYPRRLFSGYTKKTPWAYFPPTVLGIRNILKYFKQNHFYRVFWVWVSVRKGVDPEMFLSNVMDACTRVSILCPVLVKFLRRTDPSLKESCQLSNNIHKSREVVKLIRQYIIRKSYMKMMNFICMLSICQFTQAVSWWQLRKRREGTCKLVRRMCLYFCYWFKINAAI